MTLTDLPRAAEVPKPRIFFHHGRWRCFTPTPIDGRRIVAGYGSTPRAAYRMWKARLDG